MARSSSRENCVLVSLCGVDLNTLIHREQSGAGVAQPCMGNAGRLLQRLCMIKNMHSHEHIKMSENTEVSTRIQRTVKGPLHLSVGELTPPDAMTLMQWAPLRSSSLAARCTSATPSQTRPKPRSAAPHATQSSPLRLNQGSDVRLIFQLFQPGLWFDT